MGRPAPRFTILHSLREAELRSLSAASLQERVTAAGHDVSLATVEDICDTLIDSGQIDVDPGISRRRYRLTTYEQR